MPEFIAKPEPVTAWPYHLGLEDGFDTIGVAITNGLRTDTYTAPYDAVFKGIPYIDMAAGRQYIHAGDWIITTRNGDRRTCRRERFKEHYIPTAQPPSTTGYPEDVELLTHARTGLKFFRNTWSDGEGGFATYDLVPLFAALELLDHQQAAYLNYIQQLTKSAESPDNAHT